MAWRNCESYVSRAIWHGEVGCTGKRELYENMGKTGAWTACRFRTEKVEREMETTLHDKDNDAHTRERNKSSMERNLHTIVQIVMKSDSSAGGEQEGRSRD